MIDAANLTQTDIDSFNELLKRSSLGTTGAQILRQRTSASEARKVRQAAECPQLSHLPSTRQDSAPLVERLVPAAVAGDREARDLLLAEIQPLVQRYCRGRLGRSEGVIGSADDVAQDVCLALINALPSYEIKGLSFRAFVYGIAAHKVTDAFRAIGRNRTDPVGLFHDPASDDEAELEDELNADHCSVDANIHAAFRNEDTPESRVLAVELAERLGHLLQRLTPRQRAVLVLRIAVGLSAEETAHVEGSTPGAVRVTQHRALNQLRGVIGGSLEVDPEDPDDMSDDKPSAVPA